MADLYDLPYVDAQAASWTCPFCFGPMTVRQGKNGAFLGCEDFPGCRGARNVDGTVGPNHRPVARNTAYRPRSPRPSERPPDRRAETHLPLAGFPLGEDDGGPFGLNSIAEDDEDDDLYPLPPTQPLEQRTCARFSCRAPPVPNTSFCAAHAPKPPAPPKPATSGSHVVRDGACTICRRRGRDLADPCGVPGRGRIGMIEFD